MDNAEYFLMPLETKIPMEENFLIIEGARQNNLRNISLRIPHDTVTAVTGVSGSGKSSLAFETIFAEGQWRYIESLSTYARMFIEKLDRPDVDIIRNVRPSIAIEQKNPVKTSRSTVGTATEIYDYMRLLFAKIGRLICPECSREVRLWTPQFVVEDVLSKHQEEAFFVLIPLDAGQKAEIDVDDLIKRGFRRLKVRDEIIKLEPGMHLQRKKHGETSILLDRIIVKDEARGRLTDSVEQAFREGSGRVSFEPPNGRIIHFYQGYKCQGCGKAYEQPQPLLFSFNHPTGACPECKGFGNILKYDEALVVPDPKLSLEQGAIEPWQKPAYKWWQEQLMKKAGRHRIETKVPYSQLSDREKKLLFQGARGLEGINDFFSYLEGKRYKLHVRVFLSRYRSPIPCGQCGGSRLRPEALSFRVGEKSIADLTAMTIEDLMVWFTNLSLTAFEAEVADEVLKQIKMKLGFLFRVGLGYLTLSRQTKTLSGGEAQRIALANQLGSQLTGTLYVLDEPTVGLHPRDTARLAGIVREIAAFGNTVVVVEHDRIMIDSADYIVELGPGGGRYGGAVVFAGKKEDFLTHPRALTARYLRGEDSVSLPVKRRGGNGRFLTLTGARENNLKSIDLKVPLHTFTCITGVSGAGKSTLIQDTLYPALARVFKVEFPPMGKFERLYGLESLKGIRLIDQDPIGRTPRSNPVTYIKAYDDIRRLFSSLRDARRKGLGAGHFSFNKAGGRCEACQGTGKIKMEMYFFEDLFMTCEECEGKRFRPSVLEIAFNGKNIAEVLEMTVEEALNFFKDDISLRKKLEILMDVGLGYLRLGQPATTLSGGEAQRLKICAELTRKGRGILYILDEPTVGLHIDDVKKLLRVLNVLVDQGNTVLVIEHNLEVIKTADHIIDLGPEGGDAGGTIVAQGTPEEVAAVEDSYTGLFLRSFLR